MANGFLSQEEIDSLLRGDIIDNGIEEIEEIDENDKDIIGEIGNISMGSAATALSTMLSQEVYITTPKVKVTTLNELRKTFQTPNIALEIEYISGIEGKTLLVVKMKDAAVIANIMMGGNGEVTNYTEITEIEQSAVSEAMNQMIGSSATAMATMFSREVNISPPISMIWDENSTTLIDHMEDNNKIVVSSFNLKIGNLIDSEIMQVLPIYTAKKIIETMTGGSKEEKEEKKEKERKEQENREREEEEREKASLETKKEVVKIEKAEFLPLTESKTSSQSKNIDLILDVPLEITVVLGRTKKNIKDVLSFSAGSLIQLDKLAEEPVEILVNGKKVAYGEVVVVDESFGVRITSIISGKERLLNLSK